MSCQQLMQEDPYVFTDTLSNSTSFSLPILSSQTKYVPINRQQTIYSRQFRQHEPTIALSENGSVDEHTKELNEKIAVNPSPRPLHEKRNGVVNNIVNPSKKSPRTSPKIFSSSFSSPQSQQQNQSRNVVNEKKISIIATTTSASTATNHSITVSKKLTTALSSPLVLNAKKPETQFNHGAKPCDSSTGSKTNSLNGKILSNLNQKNCIVIHNKKKEVNLGKKRLTNFTPNSKIDNRSAISLEKRVVVQPIPRRAASSSAESSIAPGSDLALKENESHSREDRLDQRKLQLRRQMYQLKGIQHSKIIERSKLRFRRAVKLLKAFECKRDEMFTRENKICQYVNCSRESVMMSSHCLEHIIVADKEQQLIKQCSFLYSHGEQCRMPVFDVMSTVVVCSEHQNASVHQLVDSSKPKKTTFVARKRVVNKEPSDPTKVMKKNGKKPLGRPTKLVIHPNDIHKHKLTTQTALKSNTTVQQKSENSALDNHQFIHRNSGNLLASSQSSFSSIASSSDDLYMKQDLMTICEDTYESSEDTGVGGLSENELMPHDVIGTLDMDGSDELVKFCDDILTEPRDDEEYLDRAIEEASSVGIDQIAITAFDHFEGLDLIEMMEDIEQRQRISAATNLISMSNMPGFLGSHDQDYAAMPSPMMS